MTAQAPEHPIPSTQPPTREHKIIVSDPVPAEALSILQGIADIDARDKFSHEELVEQLRTADALIVRSGTRVTAELIAATTRMRVIGRAGVGVDNIDVKAATQKGIIVVNSPEGNTISAAEHTLALILSMLRHVPKAAASMSQGEWNRKSFTGVELYNKVVGVVGLGKIGREVASRIRAFKARVIAFDPFVNGDFARELDIELADLDTVIRQADILTVHSPLTKETRGLIGREQLASMKPGARIVNCARGGIIDEEALLEALDSGHLACAALDVFTEEPPTDWRLARHPRVLATPHLGASTEEAQMKVAIDVAEQVLDVLSGRPARAAVNIPSIPAEHAALLLPYVQLGERAGAFLAQTVRGAVKAVEVTYAGEISRLRLEQATAGVLKGLLGVTQGETVNYVNAPLIAAERGIEVRETRQAQARDYVNAITVRLVTDLETRSCEATIFGTQTPRIVRVDGHRIDLLPSGHKVLTWQEDQPGVVGRIGSFLGEHNINIAEMQVARDTPRGQALMILSVDEAVSPALLASIRQQAGIRDAMTASL